VRTDVRDPVHSQAIVSELLALPKKVRPTALFTGNNRHTVGALRALRGHKRQLALVGFDDFELADLLAMPTTVVRHDSHRMGVEAAQIAFARLDGADDPPRRVVLPTELVARGSGEVPPA
jgi:LacI family transcriptional regulator